LFFEAAPGVEVEADVVLGGGSVMLEVGVSPFSLDFFPFFFFFDLDADIDDSAAECSASLADIKGPKPPGIVRVSDFWSAVRDFGFGLGGLALLLSPSASSLDVMRVGMSAVRFLLPRLILALPRPAVLVPADDLDLDPPADVSEVLESGSDQLQ
jgi:hypothetical protein